MVSKTIREMLVREPFQPFRIRASSGRAYEVRNPGLVVVMKSQFFIADHGSDHFDIVPFLHVAGIEAVGNGHARRAKRR